VVDGGGKMVPQGSPNIKHSSKRVEKLTEYGASAVPYSQHRPFDSLGLPLVFVYVFQ